MNTISTVTRDVNELLKRPLVLWAETFLDVEQKLTYEQLINSTCFHAIIRSIDPRLQNSRLPNEATDISSRLVNLDFIIRSIRSFIQDVLHYMMVAKLPNIYQIAYDPFAESSFDEIERILLLLLACSISGGDRKEIHIEHIRQLNESIQHSLMPQIEELTEEINSILQPQDFSFDENLSTTQNKHLRCLFTNLNNIIEERDHYFEEILELEQDKQMMKQKLEVYQSSSNNLMRNCEGQSNLHSTPSQTSLNTFLNDLETKNPGIEITDYKTKMRQLKSDLDEKVDMIESLREEFEELQNEFQRVKNENLELNQSSRLTRLYRDEIDALNERISKMDKYHQELERYKGRSNELDVLKTRFDELQNENNLLCQARSHLERQVEEYRCRMNEMLQSEVNVIKFQNDIEKVTRERDSIQEKLSSLMEDKIRLELDLNSTTHTVDELNQQLDQMKSRHDHDESRPLSVSLQIQQTIKSRLLKYDLENQQLNDQLTSLKERYEIDMHLKRVEEEKQQIHIQLLNEQITDYAKSLKSLEIQTDQLTKEKFHLQNQIQDQRIEFAKVRSELESNNKHLQLTLNAIQQREHMETAAKFQDIEQENQRLQDRIGELMQQIGQIQIERDQLTILKDRECALNERIINLQLKYDQLAREHLSREKRCEIYEKNLKHYESLEQDHLELKHQNECISRQIAHVEQLEKELIDKQLEIEQLNKEKQDLNKQLKQLNDYISNEENNSRQLKNDYFLLKQRYNDEQWNELTKKLNDACDLTRQIQIKLKKKQDETELLKKTVEQQQATIERLKSEIQIREEYQQKLFLDTSPEINENEEKKRNDEVAEIQQRLNLALKSDRIHTSIQRSLKETIETLNHHVQDLQNDKMRLQNDFQQVQQRLEQVQEETNNQKKLVEQLENERNMAISSCEHFQKTNEQLIRDHDELQKLYSKLEGEFDTTINQLTDQRAINRSLTKECKYLQVEIENLRKEKQNLINRINYLAEQIEKSQTQIAENQPINEQYALLQKQYQMRTEDLQNTMNINKNLKQQIDQFKFDLNQARSELNNFQIQSAAINTEYGNLASKYELLEQQAERAEEEKSQLIEQLHNLVQQNQNLLAQALSNKDLFHEEARGYLEQLHQLMRQKELLEMKIMEQYKNMPMQKPRRSRGLIQSVSRKTKNILDRLTTRRTRTTSADGHLYGESLSERPTSPSISSIDHGATPISHARSTTPDVVSSSLTSVRHYQPSASALFKTQKDIDFHQSTDSLADTSSKEDEIERNEITTANIKSSTPLRSTFSSKNSEFVLNNHRQSPFRPIRDSPAPQSSINDLNSSIHHQRRCASTQPFPHSSSEHHTSNIHSSMRRHRIRSSNVSSPLTLKQQTSLNDHVFITEFGAI